MINISRKYDFVEENKKERKSVIIEIVCFSVLILGIIGYFVYDMYSKREKVNKSFEITIDVITLNINDVKDIGKYIELKDLEIKDIVFTTSDEDIVYIEDMSIITPKKLGEATITVKYKDMVETIKVIVEDEKKKETTKIEQTGL